MTGAGASPDQFRLASTPIDRQSIDPTLNFCLDDIDVGKPLGKGKFGRPTRGIVIVNFQFLIPMTLNFNSSYIRTNSATCSIRIELVCCMRPTKLNINRVISFYRHTKIDKILSTEEKISPSKHLSQHLPRPGNIS